MVKWASLAALVVVLLGCSAQSGPSPSAGSPAATGATTPGSSAPTAVALYDAACAGNVHSHTLSLVKPDDLTEISGVVVSRVNPGVLWVHNDSGGQPEAYAVSPSGELLGTYPLAGATAIDWEDIAMGPGPAPGVDYLYLGDIGDNAVARPNVVVYRMPEPKVGAAQPPGTGAPGPVETFTFTYPDGPHNAEALMIDPDSGELVIITKEPKAPSHIFTAPASALTDGADVSLVSAGDLERGNTAASGLASLVTGGDISTDGSVVAVRTYGGVYLYRRSPGQTVAQALAGAPCDADAAIEIQGEGVGIAPDGQSYYTISEGTNAPINHATIG